MKKILLLLVFLGLISTVLAQQNDPRSAKFDFVQGKIIIKLKDNVDAKTKYNDKGVGTSGVDIGTLLGIQNKVTGSKVLFSEKSVNKSLARKKSSVRDPRLPNPHTLKNTFVLELKNKEENILSLIEELTKNSKVEYAEPDYNYSVNDFTIDSDIIYPKNTKKTDTGNGVTVTPDDPLYVQQTNITATNIDKVWDTYTTGDGSQIIAILDTGIDYNHPDLAANIWINEVELNGVAGFDDDGNGYIDDIRGWDFINIDNAPLDDNMHGTHVAGIAGAVGNNGIGIAGASWNVKLMPIKVFQSNGVGNASTIAQGIEYASNNGATIQNMSFGSYAESFTMRNALENAYATSVLVASAGNDAVPIGPCPVCAPSYPAAYTYVIGVQDAARYSNYDQDGPIFSRYSNLLNYELKAPGSGIMSTVPNGGYRTLTGTSMSSPLVAGGISLYLQQKPDDSTELLFGNLINTSGSKSIDLIKAIEVVPYPILKILSTEFKDTNTGNDNEYFQPGKTLNIFPTIKNYWGATDDVRVGIEFAEFEDQSKASIENGEIAIGSVSSYGNLKVTDKFLQLKISDNVQNKVIIKFVVSVWSGDNKEYLSSKDIEIEVTNAIILDDYITSDMTLLEDQLYVFEGNMILTGGINVTIEPGVTIKMGNQRKIYIDGNSTLTANGTKEKPIVIQPSNNVYNWAGVVVNNGTATFNFTHFKTIYKQLYDKPIFTGGTYNNCLFYDMNVTGAEFSQSATFNYSNFIESHFRWGTLDGNHNYSNMINMSYMHEHGYNYTDGPAKRSYDYNNSNVVSFLCENSIDQQLIDHPLLKSSGNQVGILPLPSSVYFGSSSIETYKKYFTDYENDDDLTAKFNYNDLVLTPYENTHGIVWKVLVNGKDAQDEYDLIDPIGVGSNEFKVYFNREMDATVDPQISYGVREPYNQKIITEVGEWSSDGKIYTVTHDVNIGATDGINRIRVQDAQDLDYFKIPVEDSRFNILIQSAGSASLGWFATPGLGEIALTWEAPSANEIDDALGYNMYRYQVDADGVESDLVKLNESLIVEDTDESTTGVYYTDFDVTEGQTYFYKYNILRTSFETTDYSSVVSTSPLTSTLGDSNGDFTVDVMDLVHDVDYILGNNPTPFIFLAGDVNADNAINVLDIVATVDIILNPSSSSNSSVGSNGIQFYPSQAIGNANFTWEGNDLYVSSNFDIGGVQLAFNTDFEYVLSEDLPTIEHLDYTQEDSKILMLYSFNNTTIASSKTKILTRIDDSQELDIEHAVVGTTSGAKLTAVINNGVLSTIDAPFQNKNLQFLNLFPNPTEGIVHLEYYLPKQMDGATAKVYDMVGRLVWVQSIERSEGIQQDNLNLNTLKKGNYIVIIIAGNNRGQQFVTNKILILK